MNNGVARNIAWLAFDRGIRLSLGFLIIVWLARYLGPEVFGWFSYALALVLLVGAVSALGLNDIVVREMVKQPTSAAVTLGSAFLLNLISGLIGYFVALLAIFFLQGGDSLATSLVSVLGLTLIFKSTNIVRYWFEAKVDSRQVVKVEVPIVLAIISLNVGMIIAGAPVMIFAALVAIESALVAIGLMVLFRAHWGSLTALRASVDHMIMLLKQSWPLCLSGIAVLVYMRIDQVMIGEMLGAEYVGLYTAAVMLSEVWYVLPTIVAASVFPALLQKRLRFEMSDQAVSVAYKHHIQRFLDWMVMAALILAISATFFSPWVIETVYGEMFSASSGVLQIHIWAAVFVFMGVLGTKWILAEGLEKLILYRTAGGALANILLNLVLIPRYGIEGAAAATLISQGFAAFGLDALHRKTRPLFLQKCSACFGGPVRVFSESLRWAKLCVTSK